MRHRGSSTLADALDYHYTPSGGYFDQLRWTDRQTTYFSTIDSQEIVHAYQWYQVGRT